MNSWRKELVLIGSPAAPPNSGAHIDKTMGGIGRGYPFAREMSNIDDCLPCSEQEDIEAETDEFDRVIIEWR
jgi:hypothetical protein